MDYELITPRGDTPTLGRAETVEDTISIITPEQYAKMREGDEEKSGSKK